MIKSIHLGFLATHMRHIQKDQKQKTNTNYENEDQIWKKKTKWEDYLEFWVEWGNWKEKVNSQMKKIKIKKIVDQI